MKSYLFTIHMGASADSLVEAWQQTRREIDRLNPVDLLTNTNAVELNEEERNSTLDTIEMVVEGYEWTCPECETYNTQIESVPLVRCKCCHHAFEVDSLEHAYE
ncbi:MAG: hypothetical protein WC291_09860 [Thermodesulfovibrionales bacterium]|jgi:DNA primase large subunit